MLSVWLALLFPLASRKLSSVAGSTALLCVRPRFKSLVPQLVHLMILASFFTSVDSASSQGGKGGKDRSQIRASEVLLHSTTRSSPQLSKPEKVSIPERYVELDPEEPPSLEELQARYRKAEKIRNILARSRSALAF